MKRILLFATCIFTTMLSFAQAEWTGEGDGFSWYDEANWLDGYVPQGGDDILFDGASVLFEELGVYGNLEIINGSNILIQGELQLTGDLIVDPTSVISLDIITLNNFAKIIVGGSYFFNGTTDMLFSGYAPQIGNSFQVIQGDFGSCSTPTTDIVDDTQTDGFEVYLGVQCQSDGVLFTVTDINYTTAVAWDGEAGDNMWTSAANWDPNGVPTVDDRIVINLPSGGTVNTNPAGTTQAYSIIVGDNNTLIVNGDLAMFSIIQLSDAAELIWNGGEISKTDPSVTSTLINYGVLTIDGPGLKEINNDFEIWNNSMIKHNEGNLNINNGIIDNYFGSNYNLNSDNITVGYASGSNHSLRNFAGATITKTMGSETSSINLTEFLNYSTVICEMGTLVIGENLNSDFGNYGGSGAIQFPPDYIFAGDISPGSSPGIITVIGDLTTASSTTYNIEIDGPSVGTEYDQIIVTDNAILDGTINITLGYLPANDASFEVVTAANLSSCNFPSQIISSFNGTDYTFDVICKSNILYLNGPGATLSSPEFEENSIGLFPNPIENELNIKIQTGQEGFWVMFNELGQKVMEGELDGTTTIISTSNLATGLYVLQIKDKNKSTVSIRKVIKS